VLAFSQLTIVDSLVKAIDRTLTDGLADKGGISLKNRWRASPLPEKVGTPGSQQKQPRHRRTRRDFPGFVFLERFRPAAEDASSFLL
jgi:hypothetical protein